MFSGCNSLASLNIPNSKAQNISNMSGMSSYCESLTSLNLLNFNTRNVSDIYTL